MLLACDLDELKDKSIGFKILTHQYLPKNNTLWHIIVNASLF